jgi:transposase
MAGRKPIEIKLNQEASDELTKLVKRHQTSQQIALRARIVLAADQGQSNAHISQKLEVSLDTVRLWRKRWHQLASIALTDLSAAERLADLPRPGAPAGISASQRCQIEALACEKPEGSERPISHWTGREIADELIKRQIVDHISPRHAGRLLKRGGSQTASNPLLADPLRHR